MAITPWEIKGSEFVNCNCSYGCPCQFSAPPTHGHCCVAMAFRIDSGHFGSVRLDGLRTAGIYKWPGPIHKGNGTMQIIVDERAKPDQRDALVRIMQGKDTQDVATMWWVYNAMSPNKEEPIFAPIEFEVDVDARRGRIMVPGLIESHGEPIKNPVTGADHRVRIDLPNGFEYNLAEIGSGRSTTKGKIQMELKDTYGQFARIHLSHAGIVKESVAA